MLSIIISINSMNKLLTLWHFIFYVLCLLLLVAVYTCRKPKNYPPGPNWLPFVGNSFQLSKLTSLKGGQYLAFDYLQKKYNSDVIGLKLGRCNYVVIFGDLIKEALQKDEFQGRPDNFFLRLRTMDKRIGITMTDGELWKVHRSFAVKQLKLLGLGHRKMDKLIQKEYQHLLKRLSDNMESVMSAPYIQSSAMNVLWNLIAGAKFEDPEMLMLMGKRSAAFDLSGGLLNLMPWIRYLAPVRSGYSMIMDINSKMYTMMSNIIAEHKRTLTDATRDFIDTFLHHMKIEDSSKTSTFTEEQLIAVCLDLFIAGSKTTSGTLDFAILAMAQWPEVQAKVQSTLDDIQPPGTYITAEEILKNRYVEAVLFEIKRLNHVAPIIGPRRVLKNTRLNGYSIPKNTTVLMNLYSIHKDPIKWKDPEVFRPERFINEDGKFNTNEELFFFGYGKRRCPGEALAQRFINLIFTNLIHDYKIEIDQLPDGVDCGMLLTPKPYKIKMTKRK